MATFDQFIASLRKEFGEQAAGKKFEIFCKWFLENDPEWSKTVDKVWLWDEYPNKWQRQDLGTDLIFRDKNGLIWAVQAKCYSEHRRTTKGDMNSFLADTSRTTVDRRLWLQTTNKIETKAEATLKGQDKPVTIFNLDDFRNAQIDYPVTFADLYQAKVRDKPSPDPHQVRAINDVTEGLKASDRGQLIMACGTGKTFTTLWIKEALKAEKTLVLLPSLSLLSQTMREWAWAGNIDFEILNVCSDKSVGKKTEDMNPADAPFAVTSVVDEIADFLKNSGPRVVFCTYQSSVLIAEAQRDLEVPPFDLAIADEAHRCAAGSADASFATILDGEKIKATKRLFATATPKYFGRAIKDASKVNDFAVVDMNNKAVFGPVIHKLTFGQAIQDGLLNDYQVVIVGVDEPMVKEWIDNCKIVATKPDEITDARTLAAKIGMLKAIKDFDLKRLISFHSSVLGAKKFSEEVVDVANMIEPDNRPQGTFLSDYVSGNMKASDRKEKIEKLKALNSFNRGILSNARCLAEGVDVPSLDGVAFIDPKGSEIDIIQAVGRAIRKVRGAKVQTKGTIIIPVFIEEADDHETSIAASNFKPVWEVLKALRAHDTLLAEQLDQYRMNMGRGRNGNRGTFGGRIIFDIPKTVDDGFVSAIRTVLVEATTSSWEFWFGLLENFKDHYGHCRVTKTRLFSEANLLNWVKLQRKLKKNRQLSTDREKRLDELGFVWSEYDQAWEDAYIALLRYKKATGKCLVPAGFMDGETNLSNWAKTQRKSKKNRQLSTDREKRLDELGFIWNENEYKWEESFSKLRQFKDRKGHCRLPKRHIEDGINLSAWINNQRTKRRNGDLSAGEISRLDEIGFIWEPHDQLWEESFSKLRQFKNREGHCRLPTRHIEDGINLQNWSQDQRKLHNKGNLPADRFQQLEQLGFQWNVHDENWEEGYIKLKAYKQTNGNCNVPEGFMVGDMNLSSWVQSQRKEINLNGILVSDREEKLNELGFIWDVLAHNWEEAFNMLEKFKTREGHCLVAHDHLEDGFKLGPWVSQQRKFKTKDKMDIIRKRRLNEIGFIWNVREHKWEENYTKLRQFRNREGHCNVGQAHKEGGVLLGKWVSQQRHKFESMSELRKAKLNDIDFVWVANKG